MPSPLTRPVVAQVLLVALVMAAAPEQAGASTGNGQVRARNQGVLVGSCGDDLCAAVPGDRPIRLTKDGAGYESPSVSRNGDVVAFIRDGRAYRGWIAKRSWDVLWDEPDGREIRISPDGQSFVLRTAGFTGGSYESVLRVGGSIGSRLYSSTSDVYAASIGAGDRFAISTASQVCLAGLPAQSSPPPCSSPAGTNPDADSTFGMPAVSPDGTLIAINSYRLDADYNPVSGAVLLYDVATGTLLRTLSSDPLDGPPTFSPSGKDIAFSRGPDTFVVPVAGGVPKRSVAGMTGATWTAGGPAVATATSTPVGRTLVLDGRKLVTKVRCAGYCDRASWTLKRGRSVFTKIKVPTSGHGKGKVRTTLSAQEAAAVHAAGRKGLTMTLVVPGDKPRTVVAKG